MKAYTDINQSKKLAEFLPHESADGTWKRVVIAGVNLGVPEEMLYAHDGDMPFVFYSGIGVPSWSLAALLEVLPYYEINNWGDSMQLDVGNNALAPEGDETLLDLVVDMICDLHEQKLLSL